MRDKRGQTTIIPLFEPEIPFVLSLSKDIPASFPHPLPLVPGHSKKYDHKTSDLDKERHIWACEHCPHPDKCERMFNGENLDPLHFCPNYRELKKLK